MSRVTDSLEASGTDDASGGCHVDSQSRQVQLQADHHVLLGEGDIASKADYVTHLMHLKAYQTAEKFVEGKKLLEIGCNTGYGSATLADLPGEMHAIDVSEKAIRTAKDEHGDSGIHFRVTDGRQLPFGSDEFDVIIAFQLIEHVVDADALLQDIRRVLRKDGLLLMTTPNGEMRLDPGMKPWNKFHVREYAHQELRACIHRSFEHVDVAGLFAAPELYETERSRVLRARRRARKRLSGVLGKISDLCAVFRSRILSATPYCTWNGPAIVRGLGRVCCDLGS